MSFLIRPATSEDIPQLQELIELSIRQLSTECYSPAQIEDSLGFLFGPDTQLIADATYFVATPVDNRQLIVGCGASSSHGQTLLRGEMPLAIQSWSFRTTLFGSDHTPGRVPARRDPSKEAASIRAIFVKPGFTRQGLGRQIIEHCEQAAVQAGFSRLEMGSTLTGLSLYSRCGYSRTGEEAVALPNGESLVVVHMSKGV